MPLPRHQVPDEFVVSDAGLGQVLADLGVPTGFPAAVLAEAAEPVTVDESERRDRRDLPFVTIDPPGSTDLDQALAIDAAPDGGHVVWYAIADVAAFVTVGGAIDRESHERGVTLYAPRRRAPLHPPALSEDAASLLADQDRPAVVWRLALDAEGALSSVAVERAMVRSRAQLTYAQAQDGIDAGDEHLGRLATVGQQRQALETARGGVNLPVPEQEVDVVDGGLRLSYRRVLPVEEWNAQISLLCGMAAADRMLASGWGLLRTLPPASPETLALLRRHARALGVAWGEREAFGEVIRRLDTTRPGDAAFAVQSTRLFRGAGYLPLRPEDRPDPDERIHAAIAAPYAHVTAPLRRLGDRYATECVLAAEAGEDPPAWVQEALDALPGEVQSGSSRAANLERAVADHLEALVLVDAIGEVFPAIVVDQRGDESRIQITEPAIVADVAGEHDLGAEVRVRVDHADPVERRVRFSVVAADS